MKTYTYLSNIISFYLFTNDTKHDFMLEPFLVTTGKELERNSEETERVKER